MAGIFCVVNVVVAVITIHIRRWLALGLIISSIFCIRK
jgi:hypothetical protein